MEAALTMPLVIFLVLGTLQLFMMLQGRIMAEYAAFQAVRAGSRSHGNCIPMTHAALGGLLPSIVSFMGGGAGSPGQKLASAWSERVNNGSPMYKPGTGALDGKHDGPIFWLIREQPRTGAVPDEDHEFDTPTGTGVDARRLEVRLIYWYRLRIPFADWVISRMIQAHWNLKDYDAVNPLLPADAHAGWNQGTAPPANLEDDITDELNTRIDSGQYVFPIQATYGMRMMTPVRSIYFEQQNCAPTPEGL